MKKQISSFFLFAIFFSCNAQILTELDFLEGKWKIEKKEIYEEWNKEKYFYAGTSYKTKEGNKTITETLLIKVRTIR